MSLGEVTKIIQAIGAIELVAVPAILSIVQIAPIKINPWSTLLKWIGRLLNSELYTEVKVIEEKVEEIREDVEEKTLADMRWHILDFARSLRKNEEHTKEQWNHALDQARKYERYVIKHEIVNGVIEEDTRYIREVYNKLSKERRLL